MGSLAISGLAILLSILAGLPTEEQGWNTLTWCSSHRS